VHHAKVALEKRQGKRKRWPRTRLLFLLVALFVFGWMLAEHGGFQCLLLEQNGLAGSPVYYASLAENFAGLLAALASLAYMFRRVSEIVVEKDDDENSEENCAGDG
jgi:uncharacterized membrane protein YphA (DoxX/SURF4 family)